MKYPDFKYILSSAAGIILFLSSISALGQQADFEAAERYSPERLDKLVGSTFIFPRWLEDQDRFWYTYEDSDGIYWYFIDAEEETKEELFDRQKMADQLTEMLNQTFNWKKLDLDNFEYDVNKELFTFQVDSFKLEFDIGQTELAITDTLEKEKPERWKTYSPDSSWIAYAKNHNLYLMSADTTDTTEYQLTEDGEKWYSFQADDDAEIDEEEKDKKRRSIARWFEDGNKLYAKRTDVREVEDLWVIDVLEQRPELESYKYAMPGDENVPQDEVWVFDVETKEGVKLDTDHPEWEDESLGGAYFNDGGFYTDEDSDYLYMLRRNRQWDTIDVLKANTSTGNVEVLFTEESKPYFNTRFAQLAVLNDDTEYIWFSERTGWGQFYLYDENGNLKNRITEGHFTAGDIVKIDTTARTFYFEGYGREEGVNPYYSMLYKVNFDGSGMRRLTPEDANHNISASDKGNYFVDNFSTVQKPTRTVLRNGDGEIITELEQTDTSRLEEAGWQAPEPFSVKAADDATDLYGVMWKPFDFDSTKSYPVISYVYPGPQTEPFPNSFGTSRNAAIAQLGFIVVAMGQRGGSPVRSKYYHNFGYDNLRDYPLLDNKYGIEQLAARHSFMDATKVGIFGHSGGGFMSTAALLTYPDFYDVAVSSAGNHDNNMYNLWWSEVHNGVTKKTTKVKTDSAESDSVKVSWDAEVDDNPELAENLQGHLLLVHGTIDNNVHPGNTLRMADALIKEGKRFDLMMLPGKRHGFGDYNPYFQRMMWYYFAEHLLGDYRPDVVNFNIPEYDE